MTVGIETKPIFSHQMPGAAWQLLWWLICRMDDNCVVDGGWRTRACEEMGVERGHIGISSRKLAKEGLISTDPHARWVKVEVSRIRE